MNASGHAVMAWVEYPLDGKKYVMKAERAPNGTWSKPQAISEAVNYSFAITGAEQLKVKINSAGEAMILWLQNESDGSQYNQVFKAERSAGGTWTLPPNRLRASSLSSSAPQPHLL